MQVEIHAVQCHHFDLTGVIHFPQAAGGKHHLGLRAVGVGRSEGRRLDGVAHALTSSAAAATFHRKSSWVVKAGVFF